jgi:hypothetical protein
MIVWGKAVENKSKERSEKKEKETGGHGSREIGKIAE